MKPDFIEYIQDRVVLADGALGSYLYENGVTRSQNLDLVNLKNPAIVYSAHDAYIRAGSQLIETNTFGANFFKLEKVGAGDQVREVNRVGAEIASKVAGHQVYVAGSIGPSGIKFPLKPLEEGKDLLRESYLEQIHGLVEGGIDLLIIETFSYLQEILLVISIAQELYPDLPIVAQMVYPSRGLTVEGLDSSSCARKMLDAGADVVGTNCGRGIDAVVTAVRAMKYIVRGNVPFSAFPNAGLPEIVSHRMIFPSQPMYMAARIKEMLKYGVKIVGGCCGTTPAHIDEFRKVLRLKPLKNLKGAVVISQPDENETDAHLPLFHKGGFIKSLRDNRYPIIVELDPPTHLEADHIWEGAASLAEAGADAISLGENPLAILRAGNLATAHLIREKTGMQTIVHQTGRDMNALGLQSRIMEAHFLDIQGILAVTGDSAGATDQPGVSGVFDLDSFGIIEMLNSYNNGRNLAGKCIKKRTDFSIGCAFSFRPKNPDLQISRLEKKAGLGACYAMTQPLFSKDAVETMYEKTAHIDIRIFTGVFPLISYRNAEFLHNEVPGISVPRSIRNRLSAFPQVEDQRKAAMDITHQLVDDIVSIADGLYIISPLNNWKTALRFVRQVREGATKIQASPS